MTGFSLSPRARDTLAAVCRRLVPAAFEQTDNTLVEDVAARIAALDAEMRRGVVRVLRMFDHPAARFFLAGSLRAFRDLSRERQDAWLRAWHRSPLPALRTAYQALHRLVFFTYYSAPPAMQEIGARGPLRSPRSSIEGPLPLERADARADQPPFPPGSLAGANLSVDPKLPSAEPELQSAEPGLRSDEPRPRSVEAGLRSDEPGLRSREPVLRVADPRAWSPPAPGPESWSATPLPADGILSAEVCVIGSGAGGAVVACRLAEMGHDVLVLERGGAWGGRDFTEREHDMIARLYAGQGAQATEDLSYTLFQGRCVGGGTTVNWLIMLRPRPEVMDEWQRVHGAELLGPPHLLPSLERIEDETHTHAVPDDAHNTPNRVLIDGCTRLGWSVVRASINARGCVRAGSCGLGCRYGARQAPATVHLPRANAAGARIIPDVRADRIAARRGGVRIDATHEDLDNRVRRLTVNAGLVVVAAGGIGTPALLQRSGLGSAAVGRYLRLHPTTAVFGIHTHDVLADGGVPQSAVCDAFVGLADGYGFWIECPPLYAGTLAAAFPGFGASHRDFMTRFRNVAPLIVLARDGGTAGSLGSVQVDRGGRVRVRYRTGEAERRLLASGIAAAARIQLAAGATEVHTLHQDWRALRSEQDLARIAARRIIRNRISLFSAHVNGTCRMGLDARTSGCDAKGQLHGFERVWVADGSLLPTAPGVNPQATIMALASLVADRIHDRLRH